MTCYGWNDRGPCLSVFVFSYAALVIGTNGIWGLELTHTHYCTLLMMNDRRTNEKATALSLTLTCWGVYEASTCVWLGGLGVCVSACSSNWSVAITRSRQSEAAFGGEINRCSVSFFKEARENTTKSLVTINARSLPWRLTKMMK